MSPLVEIGLALAIYFAVVASLGVLAHRRSVRSTEDFFLAGRGLGTLVLFMALFGTNCTSFVLVGIPGLAYREGIGVFGLNAAIVALGVPLTFLLIGVPARRLAQELGALTPAELYAKRLGSRAVGVVIFLFFTAYTIPYMVQGVKGAALVLSQASEGALAPWVSALVVLAVVLFYTSFGGMRGTAWTNVFQGALFLGFVVVAFWFVARSLGGLGAAIESVRAVDPDLLRIDRERPGLFQPAKWTSWGLVISTTVIAFPHMFVRLMAAKDTAAIRRVCRVYPLVLVVLWVPAVLIGVLGRGAFPELGAGESDRIFYLMASEHVPPALGLVSFLAVLAAVMSTLDAQILTLSSMLLRDGIEPVRGPLGEEAEVRAGRTFTLVVALVVYVLSLAWGDSVFDISRKAFEGYTLLVPTLYLGVTWKRFSAAGALASLLAGNAVLVLGWTTGIAPLGFLPVFWAFASASLVAVLASLAGGRRHSSSSSSRK